MKNLFTVISALALVMLFTGLALADRGKPNFTPSVYADGVAWGTKGTTDLPPPNEHNVQSFDILYVFTNGAEGQLPVSDASPRNPNYNGGRWFTHTVEWNEAGMIAHDPLPILRSYEDIMTHYDLGHLDIFVGSPVGGPPAYFQCPLLPVKEW
jgi:hypothetical protein